MRDDFGAVRAHLSGDVAAGDLDADRSDLVVAARMPRIGARINNVANRLLRQRADCREHLVRRFHRPGVDEGDALRKCEDGDVAARRLNHRDVAANLEHADVRLKPDATILVRLKADTTYGHGKQ